MILYAIDGACRRNGKPDCTSAGGVFMYRNINGVRECKNIFAHEYMSTNQRGELLALLEALHDIQLTKPVDTVYIVTDSEYIFNAMTKEWYSNWYRKGWITASGAPVKNSDIWGSIYIAMEDIHASNIDVMFYHIKGHCIPFGRVTANNLLEDDTTGKELFYAVLKKFNDCRTTKADVFEAAQQLSERNNGFRLPDATFKLMVVCNTMADAIATKAVDEADARRKG